MCIRDSVEGGHRKKTAQTSGGDGNSKPRGPNADKTCSRCNKKGRADSECLSKGGEPSEGEGEGEDSKDEGKGETSKKG
eukprot:2655396-Alexandrium_andersonii.AAC.1